MSITLRCLTYYAITGFLNGCIQQALRRSDKPSKEMYKAVANLVGGLSNERLNRNYTQCELLYYSNTQASDGIVTSQITSAESCDRFWTKSELLFWIQYVDS